jgi:hypothetical protein
VRACACALVIVIITPPHACAGRGVMSAADRVCAWTWPEARAVYRALLAHGERDCAVQVCVCVCDVFSDIVVHSALPRSPIPTQIAPLRQA